MKRKTDVWFCFIFYGEISITFNSTNQTIIFLNTIHADRYNKDFYVNKYAQILAKLYNTYIIDISTSIICLVFELY